MSKKLEQAIKKVQDELVFIEKRSQAKYGKYADLTDILTETRPVLEKYGITVSQSLTHIDGKTAIKQTLYFEDETDEEVTPLVHLPGEPQKWAAAITYARRYMYATRLGLITDTDDDGELASKKESTQEVVEAIEKIDATIGMEQLKEVYTSLGTIKLDKKVIEAKDRKKQEFLENEAA